MGRGGVWARREPKLLSAAVLCVEAQLLDSRNPERALNLPGTFFRI